MSELIGEGSAQKNGGSLIKDATVETFEQDVLAASMTMPVIVDFWAEWCGPCKQLAPALEKAVSEANGAVSLVKVDIDKNQMLASQLRIQSIPTVYAFFQGRPVDGFQGAVPESEIKAFIARLSELAGGEVAGQGPSVDDLVAAGSQALEAGDTTSAAQLFGEAAQMEPESVAALAGVARCHLALGDTESASQTLSLVPEDKADDPALAGIKAAIALAGEGAGGDIAALKAAATTAPDNLQARFDYASALIGASQLENAMDELLAIIAKDREWEEEAARKKLLTIFDALGPMHPMTLKGRRRLSSLLFS